MQQKDVVYEDMMEEIKFINSIARKSKLTYQDAAKIVEKINKNIAKKFKSM